MMECITVQTQLKSRYRVFDASGKLPFDIVFGIRRRSDNDERDISFNVAGTILDVPYALVHGLLSLRELRKSESSPPEQVEVDIERLRNGVEKDRRVSESVILPARGRRFISPGSSTFTVYRYRIEAHSCLASLFEKGKRYSIGLVNRDLGTHQWISDPQGHSRSVKTQLTAELPLEPVQLRSSAHGGFATLTCKQSLVWPPDISIRMHLLPLAKERSFTATTPERPLLRITATNLGAETVSLQTRGHQRFLTPWGALQPEDDEGSGAGHRPRVLDLSAPNGSLEVVDAVSGTVVYDPRKPSAVCALRASGADLRPKVEDLLALRPGMPVFRDVEIGNLSRRLEDGDYRIRLQPRGCWWTFGELASDAGDDGRVPRRYIHASCTPLMLESIEEVDIRVSHGQFDDGYRGRTVL